MDAVAAYWPPMMTPEPPPCRRILLLRHGHYERVGELGDTVWTLSPLGRRQAVRLGRRLTELVDAAAGKLEGVYASPWPRATETAEIAARQMELTNIKIKAYLHELQPLVDPERADGTMLPLGLPATPPAARKAVATQVERVRARFFKPPRRSATLLVFSHGNLIRYLVSATLGLPYEAWSSMDIAHASLTEIRVYGTGFEALISFNETGHLPPSMTTTS